MVLYGISIMIYGIFMVLYGIRYKVERRGIKYQKFLYHCVLPVFLLYRILTLLLFKASFNTKRFKNFYSMKTCLDLNNTVDSGIYYFRRQFEVNKIKNFYRV